MIINIIKNILPPFLLDFFKKYSGFVISAQWEYMPNGFNSKINSHGWDVKSIVDLQVEKWESFKSTIQSNKPLGINHESFDQKYVYDITAHNTLLSYGYVLLLAASNKNKINVLDWGGGIGHYGIISESLLKSTNISLKYHCYDLNKFCVEGSKLNPDYTYFDNPEIALNNKYELIVASSSIWYEKEWKTALKNLTKATCEYLYITRMNFIENKSSFVAVQRPSMFGYNTEYMCWILNENEFINYATSIGLLLVREIYIGHSFPIFKAPEQGKFKGFIFKKNI